MGERWVKLYEEERQETYIGYAYTKAVLIYAMLGVDGKKGKELCGTGSGFDGNGVGKGGGGCCGYEDVGEGGRRALGLEGEEGESREE